MESTLYTFKNIEPEERKNYSNIIQDIKNKKTDGVIVKSVFSNEEVRGLLNFLDSLSDDDYLQTPSGKIFPKPFAVISDMDNKLQEYTLSNSFFSKLKNENELISNFLKKLNTTISSFVQNTEVEQPKLEISGINVCDGTFRYLFKNKGGLYVHCGNYFQEQNEFFYKMVKQDVDVSNQLSYFVVLQNTERGGELTLYDLRWKKGQMKESPLNNNYIILENRSKLHINSLKKQKIRTEVGDLLIFYGGDIWHRVEDIEGLTPRVTFGGFLNFSKDSSKLFYWS